MRKVVLCYLLLPGIALLAADQPAGVASCSGMFQADGQTVSNTATVFVGNRIDSSNGVCTIRRTNGATVRMDPQTGITMTDNGFILTRGTIRSTGILDFGFAPGAAVIRPSTPDTVILARLADNQFLVNPVRGNATLVGSKSELYAKLDTGVLMRFSPAPSEPSGLYLWVQGCLHSDENAWFVNDRHIDQRVDLVGDTVRKNLQPIGAWGGLQQLPAASQSSAQLRVVQEMPKELPCTGFTPVSNLNSDVLNTEVSATPRQRDAAIAAAILGALGAGLATIPGQNPSNVSVP